MSRCCDKVCYGCFCFMVLTHLGFPVVATGIVGCILIYQQICQNIEANCEPTISSYLSPLRYRKRFVYNASNSTYYSTFYPWFQVACIIDPFNFITSSISHGYTLGIIGGVLVLLSALIIALLIYCYLFDGCKNNQKGGHRVSPTKYTVSKLF